jgi:hypothetical protein
VQSGAVLAPFSKDERAITVNLYRRHKLNCLGGPCLAELSERTRRTAKNLETLRRPHSRVGDLRRQIFP